MDGKLLLECYHRLFASPTARAPGRRRTFADALIALVGLFAALSDRSPRWAHDQANWPLWARRLVFPSYAQLMRRLRTDAVRRLIGAVGRLFGA